MTKTPPICERNGTAISAFARAGILMLAVWMVSNAAAAQDQSVATGWRHLSTVNDDLPIPNAGNQQTSSIVFDIDGDGTNDFAITERTEAPSVTGFVRGADGWTRYVIDDEPLRIEAGSVAHDVDGDGYIDLVAGGDGRSNQIWWWENPGPNLDPNTPWTRRIIKDSGANKHHDQIFGDVDGDGGAEFIFWNQGGRKLYLAEIPDDPRNTSGEWDLHVIYEWTEEEMEQRGTYPGWRKPNEHEGLALADIDGDGKLDIVGAGRWFKHEEGTRFVPNIIDASYAFTRSAVGQFIEGGRPEVVLVAGDGAAPLMLYEWREGTWVGKVLVDKVLDGHSIAVEDFDGDGNLDIFTAEMQLGSNPSPRTMILLGDGQGNFRIQEVHRGFGLHESKLADLDGDGELDILGKPYTWDAPRLDIWLNDGAAHLGRNDAFAPDEWQRHLVDELPHRAVFITAGDLNGDGHKDLVVGAWWYRNPGSIGGDWVRHDIGAPLNNMAVVHDFDGDGHLDILGTKGIGAEANAEFVWARNDGEGNFTILQNIPAGDGDFLQGVAVARFRPNGPLEVALSWHAGDKGVQMLTVPANPVRDEWRWRVISPHSQDEELSVGDINKNGLPDLYLGTQWLENPGTDEHWTLHTIGAVTMGYPDRNALYDVTGNGRLDAVVGLENGTDVLLFASPEDPRRPWTRTIIGTGVGGGFSMDAGDIDGDGDIDVVLGEHRGEATNRLIIFENLEEGRTWNVHVVDEGGREEIDHHDGTQLVDIDGDGDLDVISVGWYNPKVWIFENKFSIEGRD